MREALRHRIHKLQDSTTIAQQMTLLLGFVCLLGLGLVSLAAARMSGAEIAGRIQQEMALTASGLADRLDMDMFERYREIKLLSGMRPMEGTWEGDPAQLRAVLDQLESTMDYFAWIGFARPDGTVVAASKGMLEGVSVAARPWFRDGLKRPAVGDVHEALLLAKLLRPADYKGEPDRFVDIAFPVRSRDGRLLGVIGAHLAFDWAEGLRRTALAARPDTEVMVLSREGTVLLGQSIGTRPFAPDVLARMKAAPSGAFVADQDGHRWLTGFAAADGEQDYPGLGWIVVARQSSGVAFASAYNLAFTIIGLGGVVLVICVLLSTWLATRIGRPLDGLTRAADEIGRNPHVTMLPRQRGNQEVLRLSAALRALLRRLGSAEMRFELFSRQHAVDIAALQELADTDPLTGLLNRRSFMQIADVALESAQAHGRLGVLMADIDHFKGVNDTYGHPAGDAVIKHVAAVFRANLRTHDHVGRFGGEEFVVLLQDTDEATTLALAERIRLAIAADPVLFEDQTIAITISIGAALAGNGDRDMDEVIERADLGLYDAKNSGRNRVSFARPPEIRAA
ncbi:diguanylate cyclase [Azorhizobium oxalatiphilum]|uniref:diguanylate cyclase n=1 Tax=Azorhizobium oxalatiphilum TaxID=980631 RepID=A0A917F6K1_9HYPH|nr:sensor domain-containing diguanylate cyclase [Azorhizobium oxalatiphilum]GGF48603.1 diguanylate cyclase [Azorhizobium oxalatiphilum]